MRLLIFLVNFLISNSTHQTFVSQASCFLKSNLASESIENSPKILNSVKIFDGELPSEEKIREEMKCGRDPYLDFIEKARIRAELFLKREPEFYTEIHHIVPRHRNGSDDSTNLVRLTYTDHTLAHYIRWIVYGDQKDRVAYQVMLGQSVDVRRERARLGGLAGGPVAQQKHKENGVGWFDSKGQSKRGKKGADVNRENGTGAFNPNNLKKANLALMKAKLTNPEKFKSQNLKNKEHKTQKEKGIGTSNPISQRLKSLMRFGVELNGKRYSLDTEQRTYVSETALDYYLLYAPKRK